MSGPEQLTKAGAAAEQRQQAQQGQCPGGSGVGGMFSGCTGAEGVLAGPAPLASATASAEKGFRGPEGGGRALRD
jgi:hypothetical protein